jgi:hypothetical protein
VQIAKKAGSSNLSERRTTLEFILQHSGKLDKSDPNAFKFIDKWINFKLTN